MAFHYKDCFIQYHAKTDGTPAQGYVEFKPNTVLVDSDTGLILNDQTIDAYLDADGKVTVSLLACDSPGITPADWSWNIEEKIDGGSVWWFQITDNMEEPINLKDLYIPGEAPPTIAVQGPKGDTGDKGAKGDTGEQGEQGPPGQAATIIAEFSNDPATLPPSGLIPADWIAPGVPVNDYQMIIGQALIHQPDGDLWSYVSTAAYPAGWVDAGQIQGPPGPEGPLGPEDIIGGTGITVTENTANGTVTISSSGVADHGQLTGLADDDHTQYHNNTRGDARYDAKGAGTAAVNTHVAQADPHTQYLKKTDTALPEINIGTTPPAEENIQLFIDTDEPDNPGASWTDMDARYVNVAGDTMTEDLSIKRPDLGTVRLGGRAGGGVMSSSNESAAPGALTIYASKVNLANGAEVPTDSSSIVTKDYVDGKVIAGTAYSAGTTDVNGWIDWTVPLPAGFPNIVGFSVTPDTDTFYSQGAFMMSTGLVGNNGTVATFRSICAATPVFASKPLKVCFVIVLAK